MEDMVLDKLKGFDYLVDVEGEVKEYAEVVLILTNLKSSIRETVEHIKTIQGANRISVVSQIELDSFFKSHGAEIVIKEEIPIILLNTCDLKSSVESEIEKLSDENEDYFVGLDNADFMIGF